MTQTCYFATGNHQRAVLRVFALYEQAKLDPHIQRVAVAESETEPGVYAMEIELVEGATQPYAHSLRLLRFYQLGTPAVPEPVIVPVDVGPTAYDLLDE